MDSAAAARIVAIRPALESLIVKATSDPESLTEADVTDMELIDIVRALSHTNAAHHAKISDDATESMQPEAKVPRLMGAGYGPSRGRFQRGGGGGGFGFRGGSDSFGRGWSGGGRGMFRGPASNNFGNMSGFGNSGRGMRSFGGGPGQRFNAGGRGFGSWGRGENAGGRGPSSGMFGRGSFGSQQAAGGGGYEAADMNPASRGGYTEQFDQ